MHIKIEYALIAYREIIEAQRRMNHWQHQFLERLASLDKDEEGEFKKRLPLKQRRSNETLA